MPESKNDNFNYYQQIYKMLSPGQEQLLKSLWEKVKEEEKDSLNFFLPKIFADKISTYMSMREDFIYLKNAAAKLLELIEIPAAERDFVSEEIYLPSIWKSIVITYGRNFTDASKAQKPKLHIKECLTPGNEFLENTHNFLMDLRHNYFAHRGENDSELSLVFLKLPFEETDMKKSQYRIKSLWSSSPSKDQLLLCFGLFDHLQATVEEKLQKQTQRVHSRFLKDFTPQQLTAFLIR